MGKYSTIEVDRDGATIWITLNRSDQLNAISIAMLRDLSRALTEAAEDDKVRVIALTGTGRAFCAGADLKEVAEADPKPGEEDLLDIVGDVFGRLRNFPKPVLAAVNGIALAGGLELILTCDIVFAAESAKLGDAHSNFGVFPGGGGAAILPGRVGLNRAKYLLFSGDAVSAAEMKEFGLVNEVVPDSALRKTVQGFAEKLAKKSPAVLRRMKVVANSSVDNTTQAALTDEMLHLRTHMRSYDMHEGLTAFREKREPDFKGY